MGFVVSSSRLRCLNQAAVISIIAIIDTGCSSDFARFDTDQFNTASTNNQVSSQQFNSYPGEVDPVTTAAVAKTSALRPPTPAYDLSDRQSQLSPIASHTAATRYQPARTAVNQNTYQSKHNYGTKNTKVNVDPIVSGSIKPARLEKVDVPAQNTRVRASVEKSKSLNLAKSARKNTRSDLTRQKSQAEAARINSPDNLARSNLVQPDRNVNLQKTSRLPGATQSVKRQNLLARNESKSFAQPANNQNGRVANGWTAIGGSVITLREGETLYNVSKRYGVPVTELKKANNITNADQIDAGRQIIVPSYIYSATAPVSAPDIDPRTRASRSDTGLLTHVSLDRVRVPTKSPRGYQNGLAAMELPNNNAQIPNQTYVVVSGDTLGAIAGKHGVRVSDLIKANDLENTDIRVGQNLVIRGKSVTSIDSNSSENKRVVGLAPVRSERIVTGSTPKNYIKPVRVRENNGIQGDEKAPARTGIDTFRWPVTGRVLSKFGHRRRGERNEGIDISVPVGTSVKAAENGIVIYSDSELQEYGNLLLIRHDGGWVSAYAHNSSLHVKRGEKVRRGQIIAKSGKTGSAQRPMIHFELRKDSNPVNPEKYLR
ncbi:MAG: LysM peptidoglycan-binding domain-containing M23 family metallopeptidase [Hyphomicrobiales bacterium]|nr:LysM peptidoglycan-binding domain-containing M23 family metallopeptidase [Hyphomicrobiales bacterium]